MKHSLNQQLQAILFCRRFLTKAIKPSRSEIEYVLDILDTISARIEQAMERDR